MKDFTIDGAQQSGSGTIVRYAVAIAALLGRPVRVFNARQKRPSPGLRQQHVTSILACAEMCHATTEGVSVGSREFMFTPGPRIAGGTYNWNIGTAGSTTMLALSIVPLALFADEPTSARIEGGVFQDFAPSPYHLQHGLAPLLQRMGARMTVDIVRPGYVPRGAGVIQVTITPARDGLQALLLTVPGTVHEVHGMALSSHLSPRRVSDRMASVCERRLHAADLRCHIERVEDTSAEHAGAILAVWTDSPTGGRWCADRAGARGRTSEAIGHFVAESLLEDIRTGATVDRHLADQLVLFAALARGTSTYVVPSQTPHLATNLWLIGQVGARATVDRNQVTIEGLARRPAAAGPAVVESR